MPQPFLEARSLHKSFGKTVALDGVSFAIDRGEVFGFIGPNGAGKSTTLTILAGLRAPDRGEVILDGQPFNHTDQSLRRRVGLGTQDLAVYPDLTARENLRFFGKLYGIETARLKVRIDQLLNAVGLTDRADDRAGTYSGGMKRRLNLAVAVVHEPEVLFLDEPTTGVDPQSRNHIFELVKQLNEAGMTIIYTSHYMEEVQTLCKRIAVIDHGQIKACDTLEKLLTMLDASISVFGLSPDEDYRKLPGVKVLSKIEDGFSITADHAGPLLPLLANIWARKGESPRSLAVNEPTLERVFLHLTGDALRD